MVPEKSVLARVVDRYHDELLPEWIQEQLGAVSRAGVVKEPELRQQCSEFLRLLREGLAAGGTADVGRSEWERMRELLASISRSRGAQGFTPSETAAFVFSLKKPLFARLRREHGQNADTLAEETWGATVLLDGLGLYTTEIYQKTREAVIARQAEDMLELSTPVVKLWDGIVALPMIGTLDSNRTQVVMETLLEKI